MTSLSSCHRNLRRVRTRRHRSDARAALRSCLAFINRLRRCGNQAERLAHLGFELGIDFLVVFEELARILAALANALALVAEPSAGFLEQVEIHGQIDEVTFARDAFAVHDVEFSFTE